MQRKRSNINIFLFFRLYIKVLLKLKVTHYYLIYSIFPTGKPMQRWRRCPRPSNFLPTGSIYFCIVVRQIWIASATTGYSSYTKVIYSCSQFVSKGIHAGVAGTKINASHQSAGNYRFEVGVGGQTDRLVTTMFGIVSGVCR